MRCTPLNRERQRPHSFPGMRDVMRTNGFKRPNEEALLRVLEREKGNISETVIRLAWNLGLGREELRQLQWSQVSFEDREVCLPDRKIPMEEDAFLCLQARYVRCGHRSAFVVIGDRNSDQLTAMSVSRILRNALDKEETLREISLKDLRHDFIIRQLEQYDWPYVARISGMAVSTIFSAYGDFKSETKRTIRPSEIDMFGIWRVLQSEGDSSAGLALYMSWSFGMSVSDIVSLTWDQIDFDRDRICLSDREIYIDAAFKRRLTRLKAGRRPDAAPYVLIKPNANLPYTLPEISRLTRTALIRGGIENLTLSDLNLSAKRESVDSKIYQYIREHGSISRSKVMELLQVSRISAYNRLRRMTEEGKLELVGNKYYLAGSVVPEEQQYEVLREHLELVGSAYRKELADLLRIPERQCSTLLRKMVREGSLAHSGQQYSLPTAVK